MDLPVSSTMTHTMTNELTWQHKIVQQPKNPPRQEETVKLLENLPPIQRTMQDSRRDTNILDQKFLNTPNLAGAGHKTKVAD